MYEGLFFSTSSFFLPIVNKKFIKKFAKTLGKQNQGYKGKLYQWMNQALGGVKEIKVLNREIRGREENLSPLFVIGGLYNLNSPFLVNETLRIVELNAVNNIRAYISRLTLLALLIN